MYQWITKYKIGIRKYYASENDFKEDKSLRKYIS